MTEVPMHVGYGCWILPDNSVENYLPKLTIDVKLDERSIQAVRAELFRTGYVEIRYAGGSTMELWGLTDSIRRTKDIWSALASSVQYVVLCAVAATSENVDFDTKNILDTEISFVYPKELPQLDNFLGLG